MNTKTPFVLFLLVAALVGCASVEVKAPKEPIKMDIAMRLDVYQHVVKDADSIEDIVEGRSSGQAATMVSSVAGFWVKEAYAEDGLGSEATEAAYRRRDRRAELTSLEISGALGEGNDGLVALRQGGGSAPSVLSAENADRLVIYRAIARKNGSSVQDVQKIYAERIRAGLPAGAHVQNPDGSWTRK